MSPSRSRNQTELDDVDYGPSRTQQRRDALAVLELAGQLVELPPSRLAKLDLPDDVRDEVANVRRITSHIARKRQLAFLAKRMRRHDDEAFDAVRAALGENRERLRQETAAMHRLEALREQLVDEEGDETLSALLARHPGIDRQHLRSLIRQARIEKATPNKPPKAYREIFRVLKELGKTDDPADR
ncbi:ribosome biogenesis factor YjgA [Fulvimonas sp. R45]|uniref:ribosome biogenesis factor YjgA n=1 Tax=Fulvimonas sp. R45 TaxID=3045937 RepID=UPI002660375B|nr:ribosome biogenesis factor YjgA [Fulvimonas sp. R45]MDO1529874.1 ribosome biogenesis factor YjgA [Fulvimonas sp. R45]